jgi:hypothetical protein
MNVKDVTVRRAVDGLAGTLDALRDGLASDVFLRVPGWLASEAADREAADREAGNSQPGDSQPGNRDDNDDSGDDSDEARDTVVWAAAGTGARVFVLHPGAGAGEGTDALADGMGALLRAPLAAV